MTKVIHGLMSECKVPQVTRKVDGKDIWIVSTWMPGSEIEIPCITQCTREY